MKIPDPIPISPQIGLRYLSHVRFRPKRPYSRHAPQVRVGPIASKCAAAKSILCNQLIGQTEYLHHSVKDWPWPLAKVYNVAILQVMIELEFDEHLASRSRRWQPGLL